MKLEAGQVWRRPDGTTWRVHSTDESPQGEVCMKYVDGPPAVFPLGAFSERYEAIPARVIEETWSQRIDRFNFPERGAVESDFVFDGLPLPDEGT